LILDTLTSENTQAALAGSAAYGLIAHGFHYPNEKWLSVLIAPRRRSWWTHNLESAGAEISESRTALMEAIDALERPGALEKVQEQFAVLFGHSVRGQCPPYELEYGRSEVIQRASDLADLSGFYAAFGMELAGEISERPDHISVESEFMAVLCAKVVCGREQEDAALIETAQGARREFLKSHLGRWIPAFAHRVCENATGGFYDRLAQFADVWIARDCRRMDVSVGSRYLQLRPVDPVEEATQSCGLPSECGSGSREQLTQLNVPNGREP